MDLPSALTFHVDAMHWLGASDCCHSGVVVPIVGVTVVMIMLVFPLVMMPTVVLMIVGLIGQRAFMPCWFAGGDLQLNV